MDKIMKFELILEHILNEKFDGDFTAAVGVVQCRNKWLLGLARATDDRANTWCFPGGGIRDNESAEKAAVREVREETGIRCSAIGKPFTLPSVKGVAFVHCRARAGQKFNNNHEFAALGFFSLKEMKGLKLYKNVMKLIEKVR